MPTMAAVLSRSDQPNQRIQYERVEYKRVEPQRQVINQVRVCSPLNPERLPPLESTLCGVKNKISNDDTLFRNASAIRKQKRLI